MSETKKTVDELSIERDNLLAEIAKLKEEKGKVDSNNKEVKENSKLEEENKQLRELIEKYKEDVKNANELVVQTLREYSTKTNDPSFFNGDNGKSAEQIETEKVQEEFQEFIKNV